MYMLYLPSTAQVSPVLLSTGQTGLPLYSLALLIIVQLALLITVQLALLITVQLGLLIIVQLILPG
jgi:hypothetical protein